MNIKTVRAIDMEGRLQACELSLQSIRQTNEQLVMTMQRQEGTMEAMRGQLGEIIRLQGEQKAQSEGLQRAFASIDALTRRHDEHEKADEQAHAQIEVSIVKTKEFAQKWVNRGIGFWSALTLIWIVVTTLLFVREGIIHP
ncbi:MAG: hypothetical protein WBR15_02755 [Gammaproteobacteria bacterium]